MRCIKCGELTFCSNPTCGNCRNRPAVNSDYNTLLAEKIATSLLTPYNEEECTRIQLMLKQDNGIEANMGGRNKQSIINTIIECLNS